MLSGRAPIIITESKENVVDTAEEIERREKLAEAEREMINSSEEIARRQRLAESDRNLSSSLRAHTPTPDEANNTLTTPTTTESSNVDSADKGR